MSHFKFKSTPADYRPFTHPSFNGLNLDPSYGGDPQTGCVGIILGIIIALIILWLLPSCSPQRQVSMSKESTSSSLFIRDSCLGMLNEKAKVNQVNNRSVISSQASRDTVIVRTSQIIREVDSVELARLGITLRRFQSAWLIRETELRERSSVRESRLTDSICVLRDSLRSLAARYYSLSELSKSYVEESERRDSDIKKAKDAKTIIYGIIVTLLALICAIRWLKKRLKASASHPPEF